MIVLHTATVLQLVPVMCEVTVVQGVASMGCVVTAEVYVVTAGVDVVTAGLYLVTAGVDVVTAGVYVVAAGV